ncbi:DNA primase large subunit [Trichonephila inaurata madagascariensis]|uniref:DNA primase large subunit n=1 Tax=Trichonephila inaurata madagascariensis TaxID=2747483 RepID=A0A8X6J5E0_9ARAC|nr:DNA primase large subunit [Trichonephila inaurata madagascariensis]
MQFPGRARRQQSLKGQKECQQYPHSLQFYKYPPTDTITLEEFEDLALERLKVLRLIERAGAKFNKNSQEYKDMILNELRKQNLNSYCKITLPIDSTVKDKTYEARRRDHVSHFILRLAYCRREDLRRWFITQEVDLFRLRFITETSQARSAFMQSNGLNYDAIEGYEKDRLKDFLYLGYNHSVSKAMATKFYKVPFIEVLDLVKNRKVFLEQGYAYIPEDDLIVTVLSAYRSHLSHALAITSRALPQLEEDTRLISMLSTLHQRYIGTDYTNKRTKFTGDVSPDEIDNLSKTSFPLCMRNLHDTLRKNHHLKYNGRLQYGLFLKGIGLSLEDALKFWREEFTKVMDVDKFDKQYTYNIRYNYGKEGKRANFSPYSCMKIITSNSPGPGEHHGCPFKHSDQSHLKQRLQSLNISNSAIDNILDLSTRGHYQIACTRLFEVTHHDTSVDQGISHPNQYFEESQKLLSGVKKDRVVKPAPRSQPIKSSESASKKSTELEDNFEEMEDMEDVLNCLNGI